MAKKKVNKLKSDLVDWADGGAQLGTPSMVLLPSRNYPFKVSKKIHKITLNREGTYRDLDPEFFGEEDGKFKLYDEEKGVLYFPAISKVLFAQKKYPDLANYQLFAPLYMVVGENEVEIYGQVIDMLETETLKDPEEI
jgi:hypothetical protein